MLVCVHLCPRADRCLSGCVHTSLFVHAWALEYKQVSEPETGSEQGWRRRLCAVALHDLHHIVATEGGDREELMGGRTWNSRIVPHNKTKCSTCPLSYYMLSFVVSRELNALQVPQGHVCPLFPPYRLYECEFLSALRYHSLMTCWIHLTSSDAVCVCVIPWFLVRCDFYILNGTGLQGLECDIVWLCAFSSSCGLSSLGEV